MAWDQSQSRRNSTAGEEMADFSSRMVSEEVFTARFKSRRVKVKTRKGHHVTTYLSPKNFVGKLLCLDETNRALRDRRLQAPPAPCPAEAGSVHSSSAAEAGTDQAEAGPAPGSAVAAEALGANAAGEPSRETQVQSRVSADGAAALSRRRKSASSASVQAAAMRSANRGPTSSGREGGGAYSGSESDSGSSRPQSFEGIFDSLPSLEEVSSEMLGKRDAAAVAAAAEALRSRLWGGAPAVIPLRRVSVAQAAAADVCTDAVDATTAEQQTSVQDAAKGEGDGQSEGEGEGGDLEWGLRQSRCCSTESNESNGSVYFVDEESDEGEEQDGAQAAAAVGASDTEEVHGEAGAAAEGSKVAKGHDDDADDGDDDDGDDDDDDDDEAYKRVLERMLRGYGGDEGAHAVRVANGYDGTSDGTSEEDDSDENDDSDDSDDDDDSDTTSDEEGDDDDDDDDDDHGGRASSRPRSGSGDSVIITRDRAPSEAPADTAADETEFHRPRRQSVGYQEDQQDIAFLRWQRHKQMHALVKDSRTKRSTSSPAQHSNKSLSGSALSGDSGKDAWGT
jgi:hypothetical protein